MTDVLFEQRKRALEEEHFQKLNAALIEHLRAEAREAREVRALEEVSGVADAPLLDELVRLGITPETLPAFALVPLFEVAWADDRIDDYERRALLADPGAKDLVPGGPAAEMVAAWLVMRPAGGLFRLWWEFTRDVCLELTQAARMELETEMLHRATMIAKASGGFLGFGSSISAEEHQELDRIRAAYRPG